MKDLKTKLLGKAATLCLASTLTCAAVCVTQVEEKTDTQEKLNSVVMNYYKTKSAEEQTQAEQIVEKAMYEELNIQDEQVAETVEELNGEYTDNVNATGVSLLVGIPSFAGFLSLESKYINRLNDKSPQDNDDCQEQ